MRGRAALLRVGVCLALFCGSATALPLPGTASIGSPAPGGANLAATPLPPPTMQRMTLRDGTQVLWVHDARTPLVYFNVYLGVGSWSPWVLQHHGESAFYAQLDDQQGTLDRDGERLQLSLDAHVGRWASRIGLRFPKADQGAALSLLRRALANVDFDRGALRRAKWARRPTFASQLKEPSFLLSQATSRWFFAAGDVRRLEVEEPLPYTTDVAALAQARDQLLRAPSRLITALGDLQADEVQALASGILPPPGLPADIDRLPWAPQFLAERRVGTDTALTLPKLTQVFFRYARLSLPCTDPDFARLLVADTVLDGGSMQSRLAVALREEGGDTYTPSTSLSMERVATIYSIRASTRLANAGPMEAKLRRTLAEFHRGGISERELESARSHLLKARERHSPDPFARVQEAAWEWQRGLPLGTTAALYQRIAGLTLAEVNDLIRRFYDPAQFALARVGPP